MGHLRMSRLSNTLTREELKECHVAKMADKKLDRERFDPGKRPMTLALYRMFKKAAQSIATGNRHGGQHAHTRELKRFHKVSAVVFG
jgi:fructose-specific phosphotransferase system component IIB